MILSIECDSDKINLICSELMGDELQNPKNIIHFFWFLVSSASYAVVAGGIIFIQHAWPAHSEVRSINVFPED
ncbi:hypothetical protein AT246_04260 [Bartonella henselae]|uniref:Uncharacterized protein n=1 Tax=Bartonella henselae TaxID=38323 RepID=X5MGC1_BARHN|nr:hypothetical protein [Bartonella henselae]MDM9997167.1 hypothetical protein [Bartonella henselae]OLL48607.1 hypothetical protein AT241_02525 [Bartonella henselae]OLL51125.1 hypothetical protein AT247_04740 [Bartonella henselae]OLL52133.1 hypothetical protein AT243_05270 [Bartonella henselae]OLL58770.1 hypothetical protein AT246_04260 [Bartonella henselae]